MEIFASGIPTAIFGMNTQLLIAIGLIVLLLIILTVTAIILRRKQNRKREELQRAIDKLDGRRNAVLSSTTEALLAKIRAFEQTDRVVQNMKKWQKEWKNIQNKMEKEFPSQIAVLDGVVESNQFKEFDAIHDKAAEQVKNVEGDVRELEQEISLFIKKEEDLQSDFEDVKETLRQVAQLFFANKSSLGIYGDKIKEDIQAMEQELYSIINSEELKNRNEAIEKLNDVKNQILEEHKLIKELPNALVLKEKILVPQLTALKQVYNEMIEQKYLFQGLSLDTRIEKISEKLDEVNSSIDKLELENVETTGAYIRKQIEDIHQIFINEKTAKEDVEKAIDGLNQRINRLRFDKEEFLQEWNNITKRYETTKEQVQLVDVFSAQVLSAETKMILFNNQYEKNEEANVVLLAELKDFFVLLNELEYNLEKLRGSLNTVKEDEVYIHAQYKQLKYMHHRSKRKINQIPTELLSEEYLMKNQEAVQALQEIEYQLKNEVLDVTHLTDLIETAQHLSIRFYKDTNMLVKAASFAEKAIIYSNRYRFEREVQRNLAKAEYYYQQGEYTEALDITLTTLEKVEPGIYDRLFDAYEAAVAKENQ